MKVYRVEASPDNRRSLHYSALAVVAAESTEIARQTFQNQAVNSFNNGLYGGQLAGLLTDDVEVRVTEMQPRAISGVHLIHDVSLITTGRPVATRMRGKWTIGAEWTNVQAEPKKGVYLVASQLEAETYPSDIVCTFAIGIRDLQDLQLDAVDDKLSLVSALNARKERQQNVLIYTVIGDVQKLSMTPIYWERNII